MKRTFLVILAALTLFSAAGCNSPGAPMSYDSLMRCEKEYGIVEGDWPESFDEMWSSRVSASLASGVVKSAKHVFGWGKGFWSLTQYEIEITSMWDDGSEQRLSPEEHLEKTVKAHCNDYLTFAEDEKALEFISKQLGRDVRTAEELEEESGCAYFTPVNGTEYKWWFYSYELPMEEGEEYTFLLTMTPAYDPETGEHDYLCSYVSPKDRPLEESLTKLGMLEGFKTKGDDHMLEIADEIRLRVNGMD